MRKMRLIDSNRLSSTLPASLSVSRYSPIPPSPCLSHPTLSLSLPSHPLLVPPIPPHPPCCRLIDSNRLSSTLPASLSALSLLSHL
ncbi:unnamed protein product [Closterium sp. NIES-65]|nr:unnamed protein product [Closterium sp. NIES-65]